MAHLPKALIYTFTQPMSSDFLALDETFLRGQSCHLANSDGNLRAHINNRLVTRHDGPVNCYE